MKCYGTYIPPYSWNCGKNINSKVNSGKFGELCDSLVDYCTKGINQISPKHGGGSTKSQLITGNSILFKPLNICSWLNWC